MGCGTAVRLRASLDLKRIAFAQQRNEGVVALFQDMEPSLR
jgi:hypothetical protein